MALRDILRGFKVRKQNYAYAKMLDGSWPIFSQFGDDIYASDVVQQAVYSIVSEVKKLSPQFVQKRGRDVRPVNGYTQAVLESPNALMTTTDLLEKVCWMLMLNYNAWVLPVFDSQRRLTELWPLNPESVEFLTDASNRLFVKFVFANSETIVPYDDVIHIRYHYSVNEYMGGNASGQPDNGALLGTLGLNKTLLDGVGKALKSSYAVNAVVKYNTMMDDGKIEAGIKALEARLQSGDSGILGLDMNGEFIPISRNVKLVDKDTLEFIDSKILRQFGVPLCILTGDYTTEQLAAFYQKTIEPIVIALGQAFTRALCSVQDRAAGYAIEFEPEELIFMSTQQKLEMVRLLGDSGALYENEKRRVFGLAPIPELYNVRVQSLNYANSNIAADYQVGGSTDEKQT